MSNNRLIQKTIEYKYSKARLKELINNNYISMLSIDLIQKMDELKSKITEWKQGDYYPSKNIRASKLDSNNIDGIIFGIVYCMAGYTEPKTIQEYINRIEKFINCYDNPTDTVKTVADILVIAANIDMLDMTRHKGSHISIEHKWNMHPELLDHMNRMIYLPPMVSEPKNIDNNKTSGYLTFDDSVILGNKNHHDNPISLDVLNIQNKVKVSIDIESLKAIEVPSKEPKTILEEQVFMEMRDTSREIAEMLIDMGNIFYWTNKYDKRGRLYTMGYHINIQSTEYKKSLINLAKEEYL